MYIIFYRTNDVFESEEILNENGVDTEIVPTPVQDKAYCGVCLHIEKEVLKKVVNLLSGIEFEKIL